MLSRSIWLFLLIAVAGVAQAATPPPAQLLPTDTLAFFCVPDWDSAVSYWNSSPQGKLWHDPAMKAFREHALEAWQDHLAAPLERQLGVKLADYLDLAHGQITIALIQNDWGGKEPGARLGVVFLVDTKDKCPDLERRLADLRKKWVEGGKQLKIDNVRDVECTTLIFAGEDLSQILFKALPGGAEEKDPDELGEAADSPGKQPKSQITLCQAGSLLIIANNLKNIEKILARQAGGLVSALADQANYEASHKLLFRDALAFAWLNTAPVLQAIQKSPSPTAPEVKEESPLALHLDKLAAASGIGAVETIAARLSGSSDGALAEVFFSAPEARRRGLLKLLATERKEAGPTSLVGSDVIRFRRWRLDGAKTWSTLENLLSSVSPTLAGLVQIGLEAAGKDRDPNFDLRKAVTGNLGDDFIAIQRKPHNQRAVDLDSAPSLYLVGSPRPEQLVQALKAGSGLLPLAGGEPDLKEREFLGRKIYSLALAPSPGAESARPGAENSLNFAAGAGYAALSSDASLVEEYLRSAESTGKSLAEAPGIREAAQKVGGTSTGFFGYENQVEVMRDWFEITKTQGIPFQNLLPLPPLPGEKSRPEDERKKMVNWFDPTLLPAFGRISGYFSFYVYSFGASKDGLNLKIFLPNPPSSK